MLVNLRDITAIAEQNNMAIGAFNSPSLESARAAIDTAEKLGYPVIIDHAQGHEEITPLDVMGPVLIALAERSTAPVCVHLDHCEDLSYMRRALEMGFNGAMFDGSFLPYERNCELGHRAAEMCHSFDCGLECELGSMGSREAGAKVEGGTAEEAGAIYTDPDQANEFIAATGCDILAVSFIRASRTFPLMCSIRFASVPSPRSSCTVARAFPMRITLRPSMPASARSTTSPTAPRPQARQ